MELDPAQAAVLRAATAEDRRTDAIADEADLPPETVTGAAFELEERGLVELTETTERGASLTEEGERYRADGLPEVCLYRGAGAAGAAEAPVPMGEVLDASALEGEAVDIALSNFARKGYGEIDAGAVTIDPDAEPDEDAEAAALDALAADEDVDAEVLERLERRDLVTIAERTRRSLSLTPEGEAALVEGIEVTEAVDRVTPALLTSGEWREADFAAYNVAADAETVQGGREHILRQTANRVKDVLVGMGFREMEGPHVDADFWINDCLFMPQDHPARTHWDRFALEAPEEIDDLPEDLLERVRSAHLEGVGEDGEGYHSPWDLAFARKLALRGHTTSLSARHLSGEAIGELEPPQRFFSVEKVYRNDTLDPTHLLEFFQIEGWVMAEGLSARDLMGTFTEFYEQFGITDLEFKPHYNPYTEPSFELFGTHPETGELVEVGNSGIFRPEMLEPLGVDADVMAWGLSLERLLMLMYGFSDVRDVHGTLCDLELLRDTEVIY
jgi:phenylalanyl-tRNA synthetase alpha chain